MGVIIGVSSGIFVCLSVVGFVRGQEQCNGELWCEQGHCCGSGGTHCCTYYYELWWFWMIWGLIIMLSCCCLYQQHRLKKRQRRALTVMQSGFRDGSLQGLPSQSPNSMTVGFSSNRYAGSELRLPTYEEVQVLPKDPPAYELLFQGQRRDQEGISSASGSTATENTASSQVSLLTHDATDTTMQVVGNSDDLGLVDNEVVPEEDLPPAYS